MLLFSLSLLMTFLFHQEKSPQLHFNSYHTTLRFYEPKIGKFTKADTVTPTPDSHGLNRYAYTLNNPFKYTDPSGHVPLNSSEDEGRTLEYFKRGMQSYNRYKDSGEGLIAKLRLGLEGLYNQHWFYKPHVEKEVLTGLFVLDHPDIPNAGPEVANALQKIIGDQAHIKANPTTISISIGGGKSEVSKAWIFSYQQNAQRLGKSKASNRAWHHLRRFLDTTRDRFNSTNLPTITRLKTFEESGIRESLMGGQAREIVLGATTVHTQSRYTEVDVVFDYENFLKLPLRRPFAVVLGHEYKHAMDAMLGNNFMHLSSPLEYFFNNDPTRTVENIYRRAYNENNPNETPAPQKPQSLFYVIGVTARTAFESMGIRPTQMKPREE